MGQANMKCIRRYRRSDFGHMDRPRFQRRAAPGSLAAFVRKSAGVEIRDSRGSREMELGSDRDHTRSTR
jgi:hypothetical protein